MAQPRRTASTSVQPRRQPEGEGADEGVASAGRVDGLDPRARDEADIAVVAHQRRTALAEGDEQAGPERPGDGAEDRRVVDVVRPVPRRGR